MRFVGRDTYLRWLDHEAERVSPEQGRFVALRGRRQVGKSRLVTEWLQRRGRPSLYYQAVGAPLPQELASLTHAVARSNLPSLSDMARSGATWPTWQALLEAVAMAAESADTADGPLVIVLDELPYLTASDPSFEATLQAAWDQRLQHTGVLLIVIGSDLAMMEAIATYGRPLYQRIDVQRQVTPLGVAEVRELLDLDAAAAFDTYLVTGGFPKVVAARSEHDSTRSFLHVAMQDEAHPLVFTGLQMLSAEFPPQLSARSVLEAIGSGERTFGAIQTRADVSERTLATALRLLAEKQVISADDPVSGKTIRNRTRYVVADPYLRFWLRFLADRVPDISRGRGDLVAADVEAAWQGYAGTAVEPLVRDAIERLLPDDRLGDPHRVGAYWTRDNRVEVDLVGANPSEDAVVFAGSVKWRTRRSFNRDDAAALAGMATNVPGWSTAARTVGISRTGFTQGVDLDVRLTPDDLIGA